MLLFISWAKWRFVVTFLADCMLGSQGKLALLHTGCYNVAMQIETGCNMAIDACLRRVNRA